MKKISILFLSSLFVFCGYSQIALIHTNYLETTVGGADDGSYSDFNFKWSGYDNQKLTFNFDQGSILYSNVNLVSFRLTQPKDGTIYYERSSIPIDVTGESTITLSSINTNIYAVYNTTDASLTNRMSYVFGISNTNIPPRRIYYAELLGTLTTTPGVQRTLAQGMVSVTHSLFNNDADYFTVSRTNAEVGQVYLHPSWVYLGDVLSTGAIRQVTSTDSSVAITGADGPIANLSISNYVATQLVPYSPCSNFYTISETDTLLDEKVDITDWALRNAAFSAHIGSNETRIVSLEDTLMEVYRYEAMSDSDEEVYVLGTTTNITASRSGTTLTFDIPVNTLLMSARVRWDGTVGSSFTLVMGTNDMTNSGLANRWNALFQAYREDTGALIPGASCRLDTSNSDQLLIYGLWTGGINHLRFGF